MSKLEGVVHCPHSGIPLHEMCPSEKCAACGWHPAVNRQRKQTIQWYSDHGLLELWGQEEKIDTTSLDGERAMEWLKAETARILREEP